MYKKKINELGKKKLAAKDVNKSTIEYNRNAKRHNDTGFSSPRNLFLIAIALLFTIMFSQNVFAVNNLIALQGNVENNGLPIQSGNITINIWTAPSGGSLVYNSSTDYYNTISNGRFDIMIGDGVQTLTLDYGTNYYMAVSVNGNYLSFNGSARRMFQSSVGNVDWSYLSNVPSYVIDYTSLIDSVNSTANGRINNVNGTSNANNITLKGLIDANNATLKSYIDAVRNNISGINSTLFANASIYVNGFNTTVVFNFNDHQYNVSFSDQTGASGLSVINATIAISGSNLTIVQERSDGSQYNTSFVNLDGAIQSNITGLNLTINALLGSNTSIFTYVNTFGANITYLNSANVTTNARIDNVNTSISGFISNITYLNSANVTTNARIDNVNTSISGFISNITYLNSANVTTNARIDNVNGTSNANNVTLTGLINANNITWKAYFDAVALNITGLNTTINNLISSNASIFTYVNTFGANITYLNSANVTTNGRIDNVNGTSNANNVTLFGYITSLQSNITGMNLSINNLFGTNTTIFSYLNGLGVNNSNAMSSNVTTNSRIDNVNDTSNANNVTLKGLIDADNATVFSYIAAIQSNLSSINGTPYVKNITFANMGVNGVNVTLVAWNNDNTQSNTSIRTLDYDSINTTNGNQNASNTSLLISPAGGIRLQNLSLTLRPNTLYDITCNLKIASQAASTGQELNINYTNTTGFVINATISDWSWTKMDSATVSGAYQGYNPNGTHILSTGSPTAVSSSTLSGYIQTNGNVTVIQFFLASEIAGSSANITRGSYCISRKI